MNQEQLEERRESEGSEEKACKRRLLSGMWSLRGQSVSIAIESEAGGAHALTRTEYRWGSFFEISYVVLHETQRGSVSWARGVACC